MSCLSGALPPRDTRAGVAVVWLRRDLRLADNPAIAAAAGHHACIPVFLHNPADEGDWAPGGAGRWWLHHSLEALRKALERIGSRLVIRRTDDTLASLRELAEELGARAVYWNRLYDPLLIERDKRIKLALRGDGLRAESFGAALLREPWEVRRKDGGHFRAFTPFWRALAGMGEPPAPLPAPDGLSAPARVPRSDAPGDLSLLPRIRWDAAFHDHWQPGEAGAQRALKRFLAERLADYKTLRDRPGKQGTSGLSPHLHWGEISPREIWAWTRRAPGAPEADTEAFLSEVGWREFAHHLLYYFPEMPSDPLDRRFRAFPWRDDPAPALRAWQAGRTGVPIVDAGMRELWTTGWMHNRVRMIVGSLLTKNLRIPWQIGEAWFWDTLVDADLASNSMGWQWIQGSGADAAPYFRIFNPVRQGERFDPEGDYVRRWVPELGGLPAKHIHSPWAAPVEVLRRAGVTLGHDYPEPIVDLADSRRKALDAYQTIKG